MSEIRIRFYQGYTDLPAFDTVEEAKNSNPIPPSDFHPLGRAYVVLFELGGKYAVWVNGSARYITQHLPMHSKALFGGWWEKGKPIDWQQISDTHATEREILGDALDLLISPPDER